jgi:hypothetical protein
MLPFGRRIGIGASSSVSAGTLTSSRLRTLQICWLAFGMQVGIGEGQPDSKNSAGMGWGLFELATK